MMKLYYAELLAPRRACALARYVRADVDFIRLDIQAGEHKRADYLRINPNGTVPALTDGDRALWEADAIMCHLSRRAGADLWPDDDDCRIDVVRWLSWNAQHFLRGGGGLYFEYVIRPMFGLGEADPAAVREATATFRKFAAVLDEHLGGRRWLLGERLTVADFAVASALPYAAAARMPLSEFPLVAGWHDRLNELPGWREPFPSARREAA